MQSGLLSLTKQTKRESPRSLKSTLHPSLDLLPFHGQDTRVTPITPIRQVISSVSLKPKRSSFLSFPARNSSLAYLPLQAGERGTRAARVLGEKCQINLTDRLSQ